MNHDRAPWRKSSFTVHENCVEVAWSRKASYRDAEDRVEVGFGPDVVGVRDTKDRAGGHLALPGRAWRLLIARA